MTRRHILALLITWTLQVVPIVGATAVSADDRLRTLFKTEPFDKDPGWESHNNHVPPAIVKPLQQDFDYSSTNFAGKPRAKSAALSGEPRIGPGMPPKSR